MSTPKVRVKCPHCGTSLQVGAGLLGKTVRCPRAECGQPVRVTEEPAPAPAGRLGARLREVAAWGLCGALGLSLLAVVLFGGTRRPTGANDGPTLDEQVNTLTDRNKELTRAQEDLKRANAALASELARVRNGAPPTPAERAAERPQNPAEWPQDPAERLEDPADLPKDPKATLQRAQSRVYRIQHSLRLYDSEVEALQKRPQSPDRTFPSLAQMLGDLPQSARPLFGSDDDRRLAANEWLVKKVVGGRLELKRELGGVSTDPPAGNRVNVSVVSHNGDRDATTTMFGPPLRIHLGRDAPSGFSFVCRTRSAVEKLKRSSGQIVTVSGRIESARFGRDEWGDYLRITLSAVALDGFNPMPQTLDELKLARAELQKELQAAEAEVKQLEQTARNPGE